MTITTTLPVIAFRGAFLSRPHHLDALYDQLWYMMTPSNNPRQPFDAHRFKQQLAHARALPGFNIDHRYPFITHVNQTLLHQAAIQKNTTALTILLKAGANPNIYDHLRQTPLHFAVDPHTIKTLLTAGANPNAQDYLGRSTLHWAAQTYERDTLARITALLQGNASTTLKMRNDKTPANLAKAHRQTLPILNALDPEQYPLPTAAEWAYSAQRNQAIVAKLSQKRKPSQNLPEWDFSPYGTSIHAQKDKKQIEQPSLQKIASPQRPFSRHVSFANLDELPQGEIRPITPPLPPIAALQRSSSSLRSARHSSSDLPTIPENQESPPH